MRIVEFVVAVVALIALFGWLVGRPHTLESLERAKPQAGAARDAAPTGDSMASAHDTIDDSGKGDD